MTSMSRKGTGICILNTASVAFVPVIVARVGVSVTCIAALIAVVACTRNGCLGDR